MRKCNYNTSPHLNLTTMQFWLVQYKWILNGICFHKFDIGKTFGLAKLICQNRNPVDCSTGLKMLLDFLWSASIVHLTYLKNHLRTKPLADTDKRNDGELRFCSLKKVSRLAIYKQQPASKLHWCQKQYKHSSEKIQNINEKKNVRN